MKFAAVVYNLMGFLSFAFFLLGVAFTNYWGDTVKYGYFRFSYLSMWGWSHVFPFIYFIAQRRVPSHNHKKRYVKAYLVATELGAICGLISIVRWTIVNTNSHGKLCPKRYSNRDHCVHWQGVIYTYAGITVVLLLVQWGVSRVMLRHANEPEEVQVDQN